MNVAGQNGFSTSRRERRDSIRISLTGGSKAQRTELKEMVARLANLQLDVVELTSPPRSAPRNDSTVHVLMFVVSEDHELWSEELRPWLSHDGWALVIAVVAARSAEAVRHALRAGANEVLFFPLDPVDMARSLLKVSEINRGAGQFASKVAYSLVSVSGGVGVSSLIVALGLTLHRVTKKNVALLDLALQSGALSTLLDMQPGHSIIELVDPTSAIDSIRLEPIICKHSSGLHLLSAPKRIEDGEMVSPATIEATMKVITELFDIVLVDSGHHISEASVAAWERSGNILYVLDQTTLGVRSARRFLDLFARLDLKHVNLDLVLNRFDSSRPITVDKIEAALRRPVTWRIPRDDAAFAAVDSAEGGMAEFSSRSPVTAAVDRLARILLGAADADDGRAPGVLSRLLSAVGLKAGANEWA